MGWPYLLGVALVIVGAVMLALVDAPRRASWHLARLVERARHRPGTDHPTTAAHSAPGLWVAQDASGNGPDDHATPKLRP